MLNVEKILETLTLEGCVGQMMAAGFDGLEAPDYFLDWLRAGRLGAVVLFARNAASPGQLADLTTSLHAASPLPLLIALDQEGGMVARLHAPFTESPGNMALGAARDPDLARRMAEVIAEELRDMGVNWNLAPNVDVLSNRLNPVVSTRAYSDDPALVAELAVAQITGYQARGVAATAKHFPGHGGNTPVDSHVDLPVIMSDRTQLDAVDLIPYRATIAAGVSSVMAGHIHLPAFEAHYPATFSHKLLAGLLRDELGFTGVITTDCMEMQAITARYGAGESAVLAALAGIDLMFFSHTPERQAAAYEAVLEAVRTGRLLADRVVQSAGRVVHLKKQYAQLKDWTPQGIGGVEHQTVAYEVARHSLTEVRCTENMLPLRPEDASRITLVEFSSYLDTEAVDAGRHTRLADGLISVLPGLQALALHAIPADVQIQQALAALPGTDVLIIGSRNAHRLPEQAAAIDLLLAQVRHSILLCLREPFDAARFPTCPVVIASYGDTPPSLHALAEFLTGKWEAVGRLPVTV